MHSSVNERLGERESIHFCPSHRSTSQREREEEQKRGVGKWRKGREKREGGNRETEGREITEKGEVGQKKERERMREGFGTGWFGYYCGLGSIQLNTNIVCSPLREKHKPSTHLQVSVPLHGIFCGDCLIVVVFINAGHFS